MHSLSDRENRSVPRSEDEINQVVWAAIRDVIDMGLHDRGELGFAHIYPKRCEFHQQLNGTDYDRFCRALQGRVPGMDYSDWFVVPDLFKILDTIQFCHKNIGSSTRYLDYNCEHVRNGCPEEGQDKFREEINEIFKRNGLVWDLSADGIITRIGPPMLRELVRTFDFKIADKQINEDLADSCKMIFDRDPKVRELALHKLTHVFERLTSREDTKKAHPGNGAKALVGSLVSPGIFHDFVIDDAKRAWGGAVNELKVRHSSDKQEPLTTSAQADYLCHRLLSWIWFILESQRVKEKGS